MRSSLGILGLSLSVALTGSAFAQSWVPDSTSNTIYTLAGKVGVGTSVMTKQFNMRALNNVTGPVNSLASIGNNIFLLDAVGSTYNEKTGIFTQFANGNAIPVGIVFSREGLGWGTALGFYTHNDDTATLDQLAERMHISPDGNVGIGVGTPLKALTVKAANGTTGPVTSLASLGNNIILLDDPNATTNEKVALASRLGPSGIPAAVVLGREGGLWGTSVGFYTHNDDAATQDQMAERVHIGANGFVGIGLSSAPTKMLEVGGDINAQGTITGTNVVAKYQDIAEWVPASGELAAGTVVVLNRERENEVTPSTSAYDSSVAGVVSDRPGMILGEEGPNKERVATTGRVKVHADATHAPIRIGDLLVTGDKPGTAMRSEPIEIAGARIHRPGTVIGKALQPLAAGEGDILVLLSLQ